MMAGQRAVRQAIAIAAVVVLARTATAEDVEVRFVARVSPSEKCPPHAEPALAAAVAAPGSELSGSFRYSRGLASIGSNSRIYAVYDLHPERFGLRLSVGPPDTFSAHDYTRAYISRALAAGEGDVEERFWGFSADARQVRRGWPGDPFQVLFQLNLTATSAETRMAELPSSVSLSQWRGKFHLSGSRALVKGGPGWVVCGELISLDSRVIASDPRGR